MITINSILISWSFQMNGSSPRNGVNIELRSNAVLVYNFTEDASEVASILMHLSPLTMYTISVYVVF